MGCDWYYVRQISGIGFSVPFSEEYYKSIQGLLSNERYQSMIYSEIDENREMEKYRSSVKCSLFIYDSRTCLYGHISIPGPYEITLSDNYTYLTEEKHYGAFFDESIHEMESVFHNENRICYWNMLTTFGVGTFDYDKESLRKFKCLDDYLDYFGYLKYNELK